MDVVPFESIETMYPPEHYAMFVATGFKGVNKVRAKIYENCKSKGYTLVNYISSKAIHWGNFEIGDNCIIHAGAIIGPFAKIGNNVIISPGANVTHDAVISDHCFLAVNCVVGGRTQIGNYSLIGMNATLLDGITIGTQCVIGSGVTITKDTEAGAVYLPNTAEKSPMNTNEVAHFLNSDSAQINNRDEHKTSDTKACFSTQVTSQSVLDEHESFPLTPIQQAYWVGRGQGMTLGGVSTHLYFEIEAIELDISRLTRAWHRLIDRHPMLRTIVSASGTQHVLKHVPSYTIQTIDLKGIQPIMQEKRIEELRTVLSHQVLQSDQWPLFDIRAVLLSEKRMYLLLSFDSLIMDGRSRSLIFTEWEQLYHNPDANLPEMQSSFYNYILQHEALKQGESYQKDADYWRQRLPSFPPAPEIPFTRKLTEITQSRFSRFEDHLDPSVWGTLKEQAEKRGLRPTVVVLAAFLETLRLWSSGSGMTINLTILDQAARTSEFESIVGNFTSSLVLAIDQDRQSSFEKLVYQLQNQLKSDIQHSSFSGVEVIRELIKQRGNDLGAMIPIVFTSQLSADSRRGGRNPMAWLGESHYAITQTPQVCLDYQTHEYEGAFMGVWDVVEDLFPRQMIKDMLASHFRLLRQLAADSDIWTKSEVKRTQEQIPLSHLNLYESLNKTGQPHIPKLLHETVLDQMQQQSDQPAVITEERTLTYDELERESATMADWLQRNGAVPNQLVAVVMGKGWEQIVAVLGILRSGAAYLPLDPTLPKQRLDHVLKHAQVELILSQPCWNQTIEWPENTTCYVIGGQVCGVVDVPDFLGERPVCSAQHNDLAYVIYTSGSTGLPKGVMISHESAVNTIEDINERFNIGPGDRVLAVSSLGFDLSVFDIFSLLSAGGTVVLPKIEDAKDPSRWLQLIKEHKITIWNSAPALMQLLSEYSAQHKDTFGNALRLVLLSGDWIPLELPDQIRKLAPNSEIVSLGGATEASIWSILYKIDKIDPSWNSIPYGYPMRNQRFYIFDDTLELRPVWVPGELYIGGEGLAIGYWRDQEQTDQSFITHPRTGERLYRTGDIGRMLDNGVIEFLGRRDNQVKIRGFRVELGEVESVLNQHAKIRQSAVIAQGSEKRKSRLIAYVLPIERGQLSEEELKVFVRKRLPDYMRPSIFVMIEQFPLSANGKIDRKALGKKADNAVSTGNINQEYSGETLNMVMQVASEILRIDNIEPKDQLLELGATSVDIIRVINRLEQELGIRPTVDEVYGAENFYLLTEVIKERRQRTSALSSQSSTEHNSAIPEARSSNTLLLDPDERKYFRDSQPGMRRNLTGYPEVVLQYFEPDTSLIHSWNTRRSYRHFMQAPVPFDSIEKLFSCLKGKEIDGVYRYVYGSAGRLYPVQTYLYVKPDRIKGLEAGVYYYYPLEHRLIRFALTSKLPGEIYDPLINRPIFDEAAFGIFLIADLSAIMPMYGEKSMHYSTIEAGLMTQLLEEAAPSCSLGLCQIGDLDFNPIRSFFELNDEHVLVHSLLGGSI